MPLILPFVQWECLLWSPLLVPLLYFGWEKEITCLFRSWLTESRVGASRPDVDHAIVDFESDVIDG